MPDLGTIKETVTRLQKDGLPVSEHSLRRWVRTGAIPSVSCGTKALLFYPRVVQFIKGGDVSEPPHQEEHGIRRLEVQP